MPRHGLFISMTRTPNLPFTLAGDTDLRNRVRLFGNLLGEVLQEQAGKEILDAVETLRRGYIRLRKQENSKTRVISKAIMVMGVSMWRNFSLNHCSPRARIISLREMYPATSGRAT